MCSAHELWHINIPTIMLVWSLICASCGIRTEYIYIYGGVTVRNNQIRTGLVYL